MLDAITATQVALLHDQKRLEFISQNASNMQTPGYKRQRMDSIGFDEHMQPNMMSATDSTQRYTDHTQGTVTESGTPSELALTGNGFFEVQTNEGLFYTRRGDFHVNEQGELATPTDAKLMGLGGIIRVDDNAFRIDSKGTVFIDNHPVDTIRVVQFPHQETLNYQGQGLYESHEAYESTGLSTQVLQGMLEQSNVTALDEMMEMVKTSRHFEASTRVMRVADGLLSTAISQLGEGNV